MTICVTMLCHRCVTSCYCYFRCYMSCVKSCYHCYTSFVTMMTTTKMSCGKSLSSTTISMMMTSYYHAPYLLSCCGLRSMSTP